MLKKIALIIGLVTVSACTTGRDRLLPAPPSDPAPAKQWPGEKPGPLTDYTVQVVVEKPGTNWDYAMLQRNSKAGALLSQMTKLRDTKTHTVIFISSSPVASFSPEKAIAKLAEMLEDHFTAVTPAAKQKDGKLHAEMSGEISGREAYAIFYTWSPKEAPDFTVSIAIVGPKDTRLAAAADVKRILDSVYIKRVKASHDEPVDDEDEDEDDEE